MKTKAQQNLERRQYEDVYKAMGADNNARTRLIADGIITADAKLSDLYRAGNELALKVGKRYIESSANRAKQDLNALSRGAAATLGSIKTEKKAASSRANGAKGGRPRKTQPTE